MKPPILSTPIAETEPLRPSAIPSSIAEESHPAPDARPAARSSASLDTRHSTPDTPHPPGRPSLFTDALVDKICDYIQNTGVSDSAAGLLAGVSTTTLSRWKAENPDFAILLEAARAELQRELITAVREARRRDGSSDWRGAAWLLEHLFPEDFGRRPRSKPQSPSRNDSAGREPGCAADSVAVRGLANEHLEAKSVSEPERSRWAEDQADRPRFQRKRSGPSPESAGLSSTVPTVSVSPEQPRSGAAEIPTVPNVPKPWAPDQTAPTDPEPPASDSSENLPETPVLPLPGRFRCPRLSNRLIVAVRARGGEPAENPQLFPKSPAAPFSPFLNPEPSPSILVLKDRLSRPTPLASPIIPLAVAVAPTTPF